MSYTDVHTLSGEDLKKALLPFPESAKLVRRKAIFLAVRRHVVDESKKQGLSGLTVVSGNDFYGKMHRAAAVSHEQLASVKLAAQLEQRIPGASRDKLRSLFMKVAHPTSVQEDIKVYIKTEMRGFRHEITNEIRELRKAVQLLAERRTASAPNVLEPMAERRKASAPPNEQVGGGSAPTVVPSSGEEHAPTVVPTW